MPQRDFARRPLSDARHFVGALADDAGIQRSRRGDLVLAVGELANNSIVHGGGSGRVRAWREDGAFVCEVTDGGLIEDPLVGRRRPTPEQFHGRDRKSVV